MFSFRLFCQLARALAPAAAVSLFLSACSFAPVYGTASSGSPEFSYAEPTSRTEQIVYQDLRATLAGGAAKRKAAISITSASARIGRTSAGSIFTPYLVTLTGSIIVVDPQNNEDTLFSESFSSSATYEISGQVLADNAARADAEERAAHALAQTIRLALLGAFGNRS